MNSDLIKSLSDKARTSIPEGVYGPEVWIEQYNEKLTELVIKECINICEQGTLTQTTSAGAASMIAQHFGLTQ